MPVLISQFVVMGVAQTAKANHANIKKMINTPTTRAGSSATNCISPEAQIINAGPPIHNVITQVIGTTRIRNLKPNLSFRNLIFW